MKRKNEEICCLHESGSALLIVLFIVMVATVLSLSFLTRSDSDLACGTNMILRTQMDQLAQSGLAHAKGLILNPQDVSSEYWTGATRQQLVPGSDDFYDVQVVKLSPSNYRVTCAAYREKSGNEIGRSSLTAEVRLDPCFAFRTGLQWISEPLTIVNGDVYCKGDLLAYGSGATINGDAFSDSDITATSIAGKDNTFVSSAPVELPSLTAAQFSSGYYIGDTDYTVTAIDTNTLSGVILSSNALNPGGIHYYAGSILWLEDNVNIQGTLVINGSLTISGINNTITSVKNFPALIVNGALIMEDSSALEINGLALIGQGIVVTGSGAHLDVTGSLFIADQSIAGAYENSATINVTADADKASYEIWASDSSRTRWSPASGAIFRGIAR